MDLDALYTIPRKQTRFKTRTLLDSGCSKTSINRAFVRKIGLATRRLKQPIPVYNADGSLNGQVSEIAELEMTLKGSDGQEHEELLSLQVINLGPKHDIFIGLDWLQKHDPEISWRTNQLKFSRCPDSCNDQEKEAVQQYYDERLEIYDQQGVNGEYIRVTGTKSTEIAAKEKRKEVQYRTLIMTTKTSSRNESSTNYPNEDHGITPSKLNQAVRKTEK